MKRLSLIIPLIFTPISAMATTIEINDSNSDMDIFAKAGLAYDCTRLEGLTFSETATIDALEEHHGDVIWSKFRKTSNSNMAESALQESVLKPEGIWKSLDDETNYEYCVRVLKG